MHQLTIDFLENSLYDMPTWYRMTCTTKRARQDHFLHYVRSVPKSRYQISSAATHQIDWEVADVVPCWSVKDKIGFASLLADYFVDNGLTKSSYSDILGGDMVLIKNIDKWSYPYLCAYALVGKISLQGKTITIDELAPTKEIPIGDAMNVTTADGLLVKTFVQKGEMFRSADFTKIDVNSPVSRGTLVLAGSTAVILGLLYLAYKTDKMPLVAEVLKKVPLTFGWYSDLISFFAYLTPHGRHSFIYQIDSGEWKDCRSLFNILVSRSDDKSVITRDEERIKKLSFKSYNGLMVKSERAKRWEFIDEIISLGKLTTFNTIDENLEQHTYIIAESVKIDVLSAN